MTKGPAIDSQVLGRFESSAFENVLIRNGVSSLLPQPDKDPFREVLFKGFQSLMERKGSNDLILHSDRGFQKNGGGSHTFSRLSYVFSPRSIILEECSVEPDSLERAEGNGLSVCRHSMRVRHEDLKRQIPSQ